MKQTLKLAIAIQLVLASPTQAVTASDIIANNTRAVVYLEVTDAAGGSLDTGTGFIVSHDGYVVTVAHLKADPTQKMWATIAQRAGTRYPLQLRESDDAADVALWQL